MNIITSLNPWFVTGLTDAEGCFRIILRRSSTILTGWSVSFEFKIEMVVADMELLNALQSFFGVGSVTVYGKFARFTITSLKDIVKVLIPHFTNYPLITQKGADFYLFCLAVKITSSAQHLTLKGLQDIINIRASLNWGLTNVLSIAFPNTIPVNRPVIESMIIHGLWMAGFVTGDGSFSKGKVYAFSVGQDKRDSHLIISMKDYFSCGHISSFSNAIVFRVTSKSNIKDIIIPFFDKYPVAGSKLISYNTFKAKFV